MRSIVLLSGGLDSTVNLKMALKEGEVVLALTCDFGQRAGWAEIDSAKRICEALGVKHQVVNLEWLADITESALVSDLRPLPRIKPEHLDQPERLAASAKAVWVPNRNGVFVAMGAAFAEAKGADMVIAGFNKEEAQTFPDNSAEFVEGSNKALQYSTLSRPGLHSFTIDMFKRDVVRLGMELEAPLDLCWSCYDGGDAHCWACESCLRFKRAMTEAGHWDWYADRTGLTADAEAQEGAEEADAPQAPTS